MRKRLAEYLVEPFRGERRVSRTLVAVFLLLNAVVLFNAIFHDSKIGYDAEQHIKYINTLAKLRLPKRTHTDEFFSPPLPYFPPSVAAAVCRAIGEEKSAAPPTIGKLLNVLYSLGLTFFLIKICGLIRPKCSYLKIVSLALLGMMPIYYKTFAFVRGEPLLAFLCVVAVYLALVVFVKNNYSLRRVVALGVVLGAVILSRQWGFFLLAAVAVFAAFSLLKGTGKRAAIFKSLVISLVIALAVGGWFYASLWKRYGRITAFNRKPSATFSLANQPARFYTGLGLDMLFTKPLRPEFPNQLVPIFYSEFWGDYECYFVVYGKDTLRGEYVSGRSLERDLAASRRYETNYAEMGGYLGRVNLVSLLPSAVFLAGMVLGIACFARFALRRNPAEATAVYSLFALFIVASAAGYLWFLIMYPSPNGDTIKATYLIQTYPFVAILAAELLYRLRAKSAAAHHAVVVLLALVLLHNFGAYITRHTPW